MVLRNASSFEALPHELKKWFVRRLNKTREPWRQKRFKKLLQSGQLFKPLKYLNFLNLIGRL
jgi:hypothetical protein